MYPTIHNFDTNPLHAYPILGSSGSGPSGGGSGAPPANSSSRPVAPAAAAPSPRANGPPHPPPAFPTLQVAIDPRFNVSAPVRAPSQPPSEGGPSQPGAAAPPPPPGHPAPGGSREPLDLGLERRLMQELANGSSGGGAGAATVQQQQQQQQQRDDPFDILVGRYTDMGFGREEVAMALAVVGPDHADDADKVVDACRKYKRLCSMGFRSTHVAGALVMHEGDAEDAASTCLDATG